MEKTYTITITIHDKVKTKHIEVVEEESFKRAFEMIQEGYGSGELCVVLPNSDREVRGWWTVSKD